MAAIIRGKVKVEISKDLDDHYSMMTLLEKEICRKWKIKRIEFREMLEEYLILKKRLK